MTTLDWLMLLALSVLWGGSFFFVELGLDGLGPFTLVTGRVALGAVTLLLFLRLKGVAMPAAPAVWGAFLVMGALNNAVPFTLIAWGQVHIESGLASILNATTPLFTVVLAHLLTRDERITPGKLAGVALGILGVTVLIGPDALAGLGAHGIAQIAVLGGAASYACAGIYGRRFRTMPPAAAAAGMLCASTLLMIPLAVTEQPWNATPGPGVLLPVLALGVLCTALAYLLYFRILASAGATNLLLVTFLIPVSALILGISFLGEQPHWSDFAGMGLILTGLLAIDGRLRAALRGRSPAGAGDAARSGRSLS